MADFSAFNQNRVRVNVSGKIRNRLLKLLVIPMLMVSVLFSIETYRKTQSIAKESFDESLVILTLAIMGQEERFFGDSIAEDTIDIIHSSTGDVFFYHILAQQGGFVSGYSNPPRYQNMKKARKDASGKPFLFDGDYQGKPIRAVMFRLYTNNDTYTGWVELTVWKYLDKQHDFQKLLFNQFAVQLVILISLITGILWFGIRYGLKPLNALQKAVGQRSIDDLTAIKRAVPFEVQSLVVSMNDLFYRLEQAIEKRERFLGNASHQLKTPLARIKMQAEMALREKDEQERLNKIQEIVELTGYSSRLANQMLSLLRVESAQLLASQVDQIELNSLTKRVAEYYALDITRANRALTFEETEEEINLVGHSILLTEAIGNLIENSMAYSKLQTAITIEIRRTEQHAEVWVIDSGPGIARELQGDVVSRFYRVAGTQSSGCGLGLSIVSEIAKSYSGKLIFDGPNDEYFAIGLRLPL